MKLSSCSKVMKTNSNTEMNEESNGTEGCEFSKLNDDSVLCIFKYLDPKELTICERVSKTWRNLALVSWKGIQSLVFHKYFGNFGQPILSNIYLQNILMKTGEYLKEIDMSHITFQKLYPGFGKIIAEFCPRLRFLNLNQIPVTDEELKDIAHRCSLLEALHLDRCIKITDIGLLHVLTRCPSLKSLTLSYDIHIKGTCFLQKTNKLNLLELNISGTEFEPSNYLNLCDSCANLENLNLSSTQLSSNAILNIWNSLTNLTTLSLNGCSLLDSDNWRNLDKMPSLRSLYLNNVMVCDITFKAVGFSCPFLHRLEISGLRYNNINESLHHLRFLKQLQYLNISHCLYLNEHGLSFISELSSLKSLILTNCSEVDNSGISLMLAGNHSLQYLDIRSCRRISERSCKLFELYVTNKTNKLLVLAGSTGIPKSYADKKYDNLQFNMSSLTEEFIVEDSDNDDLDDYFDEVSDQDDLEEYFDEESVPGDLEEYMDGESDHDYLEYLDGEIDHYGMEYDFAEQNNHDNMDDYLAEEDDHSNDEDYFLEEHNHDMEGYLADEDYNIDYSPDGNYYDELEDSFAEGDMKEDCTVQDSNESGDSSSGEDDLENSSSAEVNSGDSSSGEVNSGDSSSGEVNSGASSSGEVNSRASSSGENDYENSSSGEGDWENSSSRGDG